MVSADEEGVCAGCGGLRPPQGSCLVCGATPRAIELKILPRDAGEAASSPPAVKLVRQLKMPTVDHLLADPGVAELPGAMRSVEEALHEGDLAAADRLLDQALGAVLVGPGHDRRTPGWGFLPVVLWMWCGVLVLLFLLSLWM